ncbi:MAG: hypothetical protein IJ094_02745 [Bacilli bacterium]|nr:hypothetical protein [Bacilli bacterium]
MNDIEVENKTLNEVNKTDSKDIIILNPHQKRIEEIRKTIDALLDIRLGLSTSKLISNKMSINELKEILEKQKEKEKDEIVSKEIDELFKDIIPINKNAAISMIDKEIDKQVLSLEELQKEMHDSYKESEGNQKGVSRVLTDKNHKSSQSSSQEAA